MTPEGKIYHLNLGIKKLKFKIENWKNVVILRFAKYFNHVVEEILSCDTKKSTVQSLLKA